jgi:nucleoside-diphosphate-sugar epimerase
VSAISPTVAERLAFAEHKRDPRTAVTVLRFAIVYGPRAANWSAVEQLFHRVRRDDVVEVGSLRTARRFIHVTDIASGILSAVGATGYQVFNLSGDRLVTLADIIDASSIVLDRSPRITDLGQPPSVRNPSNEKAHRILGWKPSLDLPSGLRTLLAEGAA